MEAYPRFSQLPAEPHILAVLKPVGSKVHDAESLIKAYTKHGYMGETDIVDTRDNEADTVKLIAEQLESEPYDAVVALGGDGTMHSTAIALYNAPDHIRRRTALIPTNLGSMNDAFAMLIGTDPHRLHKLGSMPTATFNPLLITMTDETKSTNQEIALLYSSCNYSANLTETVDSADHRMQVGQYATSYWWRQYHDVKAAGKTLVRSAPVWAEPLDGNGRARWVQDIMHINGNRIGGKDMGRGNLLQHGFYEHVPANRVHLLMEAGRLAVRNYFGASNVRLNGLQRRFYAQYKVSTRDGEPLVMQRDGQHYRIKSGSTIHTGIAEDPIRVGAPAWVTPQGMYKG